MDARWRRRIVSAGWIMIGVVVLVQGAWVVVQAAIVNSSDASDRRAGWANILALPVAALGTAIVLFDRARARSNVTPAEEEASESSATVVPPWMSREPDDVLIERTDLDDAPADTSRGLGRRDRRHHRYPRCRWIRKDEASASTEGQVGHHMVNGPEALMRADRRWMGAHRSASVRGVRYGDCGAELPLHHWRGLWLPPIIKK